MTAYNVVGAASLVSGQPEDVSQVLANFNLIATLLNGNIDNSNINAAAAILASKLAGYPTDALKALRGDGSWVTTPSGLVYRKTTVKQVVNTVVQTDLLNAEINIGAGVMGANGVLRITLIGDMLNNTGATQNFPRFFLRYNAGTTIIDTSTLINFASAATRNPWKLEATIANLGATNSQWTEFLLSMIGGSGGATAVASGVGSGYGYLAAPAGGVGPAWHHICGASAVDSTVAQALVFAVVNPLAHVNYDVTLRHALIEVIQ